MSSIQAGGAGRAVRFLMSAVVFGVVVLALLLWGRSGLWALPGASQCVE